MLCRVKRLAIRSLIDWLAVWLGDWLADWLIDWLADWLPGWLTDWLPGWLTDWLTDGLTGWVIDWLTAWLIDRLTVWLTDWLTDWLTGWLNKWLTNNQPTSYLTNGLYRNDPFCEADSRSSTRRSITVFTQSRHLTLSWTWRGQSTSYFAVSLRSILMLSWNLGPNQVFQEVFSTQTVRQNFCGTIQSLPCFSDVLPALFFQLDRSKTATRMGHSWNTLGTLS
jgi:hypothetical protein